MFHASSHAVEVMHAWKIALLESICYSHIATPAISVELKSGHVKQGKMSTAQHNMGHYSMTPYNHEKETTWTFSKVNNRS